MTIGLINAGIGNIGSLKNALYSQGWDVKIISNASEMAELTHLILPGVGSFAVAMENLTKSGLIEPIKTYAKNGFPIMGICIGMHLFSDFGEEGGGSNGLGLIPGKVILFDNLPKLPLPHVGWNEVNFIQKHPVLEGVKQGSDFYFLHSYYFDATQKSNVFGVTEYGITYPSFISNSNIVGLQFHPEKSQRSGLQILDNFCSWDGLC